jgi:hypothetical protein
MALLLADLHIFSLAAARGGSAEAATPTGTFLMTEFENNAPHQVC